MKNNYPYLEEARKAYEEDVAKTKLEKEQHYSDLEDYFLNYCGIKGLERLGDAFYLCGHKIRVDCGLYIGGKHALAGYFLRDLYDLTCPSISNLADVYRFLEYKKHVS